MTPLQKLQNNVRTEIQLLSINNLWKPTNDPYWNPDDDLTPLHDLLYCIVEAEYLNCLDEAANLIGVPQHKLRTLQALNEWQIGETWSDIAKNHGFPSTQAAVMATRRLFGPSGRWPKEFNDNPPTIPTILKEEAHRRCVLGNESWKTVGPELGWASGSACQSSVKRWAKAQNLNV